MTEKQTTPETTTTPETVDTSQATALHLASLLILEGELSQLLDRYFELKAELPGIEREILRNFGARLYGIARKQHSNPEPDPRFQIVKSLEQAVEEGILPPPEKENSQN